jgi:hypothetical protein
MTLLAAYVAICCTAMSKTAALATYADIDLSVPYRPKPFVDVPAVLMCAAAVSTLLIVYSKGMDFLI